MATPMVVREGIQYGFLEPDDEQRWEIIDAHHRERGVDPPSRQLCRTAIAESEAGLSYFILQPILHTEPMFLHPAHKHTKGVLVNLIAMIQAFIEKHLQRGVTCYVVADTAETVAMCKAMGMQKVTSPVYVKKLTKPDASKNAN